MHQRHLEFELRPRVYVVSDVRLHREGLVSHLKSDGNLCVLGAGSGDKSIHDVHSNRPDAVVLDVQTDDVLVLPTKLKALIPTLRIIGYAVCEIDSAILDCARAGLCSFVGRDASASELIDAILHAMKNELTCSPKVSSLLFNELAAGLRGARIDAPATPLTPREREVACLIASGLANKEIARKLNLSNPTVKNHVHHILHKLEVVRRSQIASMLSSRDLSGRDNSEQRSEIVS